MQTALSEMRAAAQAALLAEAELRMHDYKTDLMEDRSKLKPIAALLKEAAQLAPLPRSSLQTQVTLYMKQDSKKQALQALEKLQAASTAPAPELFAEQGMCLRIWASTRVGMTTADGKRVELKRHPITGERLPSAEERVALKAQGQELIEKAIRQDPKCATAYVYRAWARWGDDQEGRVADMRRALSLLEPSWRGRHVIDVLKQHLARETDTAYAGEWSTVRERAARLPAANEPLKSVDMQVLMEALRLARFHALDKDDSGALYIARYARRDGTTTLAVGGPALDTHVSGKLQHVAKDSGGTRVRAQRTADGVVAISWRAGHPTTAPAELADRKGTVPSVTEKQQLVKLANTLPSYARVVARADKLADTTLSPAAASKVAIEPEQPFLPIGLSKARWTLRGTHEALRSELLRLSEMCTPVVIRSVTITRDAETGELSMTVTLEWFHQKRDYVSEALGISKDEPDAGERDPE
ncbi:MAG: hypothetical protein KGY99_11460 [Phycisphaerae bacterium]|nr:hypothetical protein [Phycisphaerae bacterium]